MYTYKREVVIKNEKWGIVDENIDDLKIRTGGWIWLHLNSGWDIQFNKMNEKIKLNK